MWLLYQRLRKNRRDIATTPCSPCMTSIHGLSFPDRLQEGHWGFSRLDSRPLVYVQDGTFPCAYLFMVPQLCHECHPSQVSHEGKNICSMMRTQRPHSLALGRADMINPFFMSRTPVPCSISGTVLYSSSYL